MRFTPFTGPKNPIKHGENANFAKSTRVYPPTGAPSQETAGFGGGLQCSRVKNASVLPELRAYPTDPPVLRILTLPPLQKHFVNIFFVFAWEVYTGKWRGFLVNFFWSPYPTKRSTKTPQKIRGKFGEKFGAKSGTKI